MVFDYYQCRSFLKIHLFHFPFIHFSLFCLSSRCEVKTILNSEMKQESSNWLILPESHKAGGDREGEGETEGDEEVGRH